MRNCQRCRPCNCGCNQERPQTGGGCGCVETIIEPTVHCCTEQHHHKRVRHIVPVVHHQTNHHHRHHDYVVKRKFTQEHNHHEHGRRNPDWCREGAGNCGGGRGESMPTPGRGYDGRQGESMPTSEFGYDGGEDMYV